LDFGSDAPSSRFIPVEGVEELEILGSAVEMGFSEQREGTREDDPVIVIRSSFDDGARLARVGVDRVGSRLTIDATAVSGGDDELFISLRGFIVGLQVLRIAGAVGDLFMERRPEDAIDQTLRRIELSQRAALTLSSGGREFSPQLVVEVTDGSSFFGRVETDKLRLSVLGGSFASIDGRSTSVEAVFASSRAGFGLSAEERLSLSATDGSMIRGVFGEAVEIRADGGSTVTDVCARSDLRVEARGGSTVVYDNILRCVEEPSEVNADSTSTVSATER
jgi:hypothetical protein